jgi:hypothetical protein
MRAQTLNRIFRVLLVGTAGAGSAIACGGKMSDGELFGPEPSGDPTAKQDPLPPDPKPRADGGRDVRQPDVVVRPDVVTWDNWTGQCRTGDLAPDDSLCCTDPPGPFCVGGSGDPDAGLCGLDCKAVCERVAPGSSTGGMQGCNWSTSPAGDARIYYYCGACGVGRVPAEVAPCARGEGVAARLAMQAYYEAASVVAFDRLVAALRRARAPRSLVDAARRASADERRHAETFAALARARGAVVRKPALGCATPSLLEIALENAAEGCVRETYGALVTAHQAEHAQDPALRAAFASIAGDEAAHAALSWRLARWLDARLTPAERRRVARARRDAVRALRPAAAIDATDRALGVPPRERGVALFDGLFAALAQAA